MLLNSRRIMGTVAHMMLGLRGIEEFHRSWSQMVEYNADYVCSPQERIHYTSAAVSDHAFARNMLAAQMLGDWILMLDTDHEFDPDLLARMLRVFEGNDLDILSGLYHYRAAPHPPVWWARKSDGTIGQKGDWERREGIYLVPLGSAGGGCLLVRRRVFTRIEEELHEPPFMHRKTMSEDHSFFDRCHELGIQAYGCPAIECPHVGSRAVSLKDYHADPLQLEERIAI